MTVALQAEQYRSPLTAAILQSCREQRFWPGFRVQSFGIANPFVV
jgi:hypothetical protein